jgi:hypothetical protein
VSFGQYHVYATLARFDKKVPREGTNVRDGKGAGVKGVRKQSEGVLTGKEVTAERGNLAREVRVGDVVVRMGGAKKLGEEGRVESAGVGELQKSVLISMDKPTEPKRLVKMYRSREEDLKWARRGMVGTVINGESIPLIQKRVEDGGFQDLDIIPLGADKVFIHSLSESNVADIVGNPKPFFDLIFSQLVSWKTDVLPFQRGAWLRVYGIPLHAWNESFFKLCVVECGRYLRSDNASLARERFNINYVSRGC